MIIQRVGDHLDLPSFPTRRSSDLFVRPKMFERATRLNNMSPTITTWRLSILPRFSRIVIVGDILFSRVRSEEHTSELQSQSNLVCRLLLEKKNKSRLFADTG